MGSGAFNSIRNDLINRFNPARRFSINHLGVYKRGSNGRNVASLVSFNELLELWEKSQQILLDLIQATSSEKFTQLAPSNKSEEAKSLLQTCLFYHFHESYHLGQLGLLRRILGKEGGIP